MLKDRYFYPLTIALIASMIWYALSKSDHKKLTVKQIEISGFVTEGEYLQLLNSSPGTSYTYLEKTNQEKARIILKSNKALKDAASAGVFATLDPNYEKAFANRDLRITIRARQGTEAPLSHFYMAYFTNDVGDSGWQRKDLTAEWKDYIIEFRPKTPVNNLGVDFLGVWPGEKGAQETMEIQSMKIDVLPRLRR